MKKLILSIVFPLLLLASLLAEAASLEYIVTPRRGYNLTAQQIEAYLRDPVIVKKTFTFSSAERTVLEKNGMTSLSQSLVIEFRSEKAAKNFLRSAREQKWPLYFSPRDVEVKAQGMDLRPLQWALSNTGRNQNVDIDPMVYYKVQGVAGEDINIKDLLQFSSTEKILVAVLDTGIQKTHPALKNVIKNNPSECAALEKYNACLKEKPGNAGVEACNKIWFDMKNPEVDLDKNGYPLDCMGWTLLPGNNPAGMVGMPDFEDPSGHGTHVAGIIAAQLVNGAGSIGVSSRIQIVPVQVIGGAPSEPIKPLSIDIDPQEGKLPRPNRQTILADMVARGVIYAVNSGAKVMNLSLGWPQGQDSAFLRLMIQEAQSRGIIIVAAAGNDSTKALLRPCAYPGVICVGAHGADGAIAHYSNYGSGVDVVAPGTNILSTYPDNKRAIRMRQTNGYEFLSGTSQATPYVAALAAEMLLRGMPANEVYSRLVLGARPSQKPKELVFGMPHEPESRNDRLLKSDLDQNKYSLSGNVDFARSLAVQPQPLVIPFSKERAEIKWNRRDDTLVLNFSLKNTWAEFDASRFAMNAKVLKVSAKSVRPEIQSIQMTPAGGMWKSGEVRQVSLTLKITDQVPSLTRIPSELEIAISTTTGINQRSFVIEAEVIASVDMNVVTSDMEVFPLVGMPQMRTDVIPVTENLDGQFKYDYILGSYAQNEWQYFLMSQPEGSRSAYKISQPLKIKPIKANADETRETVVRVDANNDGKPEYIFGILDDRSRDKEDRTSPITYLFLDDQFKLLETVYYDSKMSQIPYAEAVKWQQINGKRRPVWIGPGRDPDKKRNLWDFWTDPDDKYEIPELRLYYLNEKNEIKAQQKHGDFKIVDVLQPSTAQAKAGIVPILLAKNHGTELAPSYVYDFAMAEFIEGEIRNFKELDLFSDGQVYRNLLDTRIGSVLSLDYENEVAKGTFWFSEGKNREQQLSILTNGNHRFYNEPIAALRDKVDAALWVRTVFAGDALRGAFVFTNSEIQFHDLSQKIVTSKSMERYSFFPNMVFVNLQNPIVVGDKNLKSKIPALYLTESSGLGRGVKITVPHYHSRGDLVELVAPARLRLRAEQGCKPLDNPIWGGSASATSLDYDCSDRSGRKIIRVKLDY